MASRRRAREFAVQALYQADLSGTTVSVALNSLWAGIMDGEGIDDLRPPVSEEMEFAQRLAHGVEQRLDEIDSLIEGSSTNWRLARMPLVDRNILRIAVFELMACDDIPPNVSINEAVELAKRFGATESRAFVNGIIDKIRRRLQRI
ncbi:MAG: transcription antitermination factor NusB [Proteobacteria bacterium]|nr:transcription antitermination factor NusB [Pseudomonadota bacterium]